MELDPLLARMPPHSLPAERFVLASCFAPFGGMKELEVPLLPEDFYSCFHSLVWRSILSLHTRGIPIDYLSILNDLERNKTPATMKDQDLLLSLGTETVASAGNVNYYARIVMTLRRKRDLIEAGARIMEMGYESAPLEDLIDRAHTCLFNATDSRSGHRIHTMREVSREFIRFLDDETADSGVSSGFFCLDQVVQTFRPGELGVLAARPSMGKTSLALCLARSMVAMGHRVGIVSLEMERLQLFSNTVAQQSGIDSTKVRRGLVDEHELQPLWDAIEKLAGFEDKIVIHDGHQASVTDLRRIATRMVQLHGIQILMVDYLQLVTGSERTRSRGLYDQVTEVSKALKSLARWAKIHVLALCQLSRKCEERQDKRPLMSDLRDSGYIEQDMDVGLLLYRPEVYKKDDPALRGKAFVDVAKNRNGPTGVVELTWIKETMTFEPA